MPKDEPPESECKGAKGLSDETGCPVSRKALPLAEHRNPPKAAHDEDFTSLRGPLQGQQIRASEEDTGTYLLDRFDAIADSHTEWNIEGIPQTLNDTIKYRFADGSTFTIITVTKPGESGRSYVGEVLIRRIRR